MVKQDEKPTADDLKDVDPIVAEEDDVVAEDNDVSMIVHREYYTENNLPKIREHGPMPVSEWADYEREHNL